MKRIKICLLGLIVMVCTVLALDVIAMSRSDGQIVSISSGSLYIKDKGSDELRALQAGDTLYLGDQVIAGEGVQATLKLSKPRGTSNNNNLVSIRPIPGQEYTVNVKLQRKDDGSIEVTISP